MSMERDTVGRQMAFALYGAANRVMRLHKPFLAPLGLTYPQYLVIVDLLDGSPRTVGELGRRLGMDTGMLTPLLKRLEVAGMVTRNRDVADERRVLVDLTPASRAIEDDVRAVNGQIRAACHLSEDNARELHRTLEGLGHPATN